MKFYKYIFAAALLTLSGGVFTSCDDDDEEVVSLPTEFTVELSSVNVLWNETEGVVDFGANEKWTAKSSSSWITVDPSKGSAGDHRLYLLFAPNHYLMPRSGQVQIQCGDKTGVVNVLQGGCSDESLVAPLTLDVEVQSLDYESTEIDLSQYAADIQGNLGLTVDEFAKGVDDDGDIEFFLIDKSNNWVTAGTGPSRCSAWLDKNLNITQWDASGYPAIATWIATYGGDKPVLEVGRAPGVPDDAKYKISFGYTLPNDHSKYLIVNLTVTFPAMDLKGTVVDTKELYIDVPANSGYVAVPAFFDADEIASLLGASNITLAKVVSYDEDGEWVSYTGGNGYWYDTKGAICSWGDGAGWYIEYWGEEDTDPADDDYHAWNVGPYPGVTNASGTSSIGFWYNQNVVMFNIHVTITGSGDE